MLEQIGKNIEKSVNKAGIAKQVQAAQICLFWQEAVRDAFGNKSAEKSQAIQFKDGTLTVAVLSSVLAQEFKFREEFIKNSINDKIKENVVRKIRFEI